MMAINWAVIENLEDLSVKPGQSYSLHRLDDGSWEVRYGRVCNRAWFDKAADVLRRLRMSGLKVQTKKISVCEAVCQAWSENPAVAYSFSGSLRCKHCDAWVVSVEVLDSIGEPPKL